MNKKASLKDIAQKAGVSITLVSYVLNNQKEDRINKETAKRIRDAAKQLNYRTNQIAKSLKTNKTYTIGLILADIANPFSSSLARIIEDEADKHNYTVIFGSSDEKNERSEKLITALLNRQVDGLIISPPVHAEKQIKDLRRQGVPLVLVDRCFPSIKTNYVILDNYNASFDAIQHLVDTGRKNIGMITYGTELFHLQERKRGYLEALRKNKITVKKNWLQEVGIDNDKAAIEKALDELLNTKSPVNAVLFGSNSIAAIALKYINSLPVKVPQQLAIVSFDETEALDLFYSPLTYIKQPLREMGQMATRILLDAIENKKTVRQADLKAQLVIRHSTLPGS